MSPSQVGATFYEHAEAQEVSISRCSTPSSTEAMLNNSLDDIIALVKTTKRRQASQSPLPSTPLYHAISPATTPAPPTTREGQEHASEAVATAQLSEHEERLQRLAGLIYSLTQENDSLKKRVTSLETKQADPQAVIPYKVKIGGGTIVVVILLGGVWCFLHPIVGIGCLGDFGDICYT